MCEDLRRRKTCIGKGDESLSQTLLPDHQHLQKLHPQVRDHILFQTFCVSKVFFLTERNGAIPQSPAAAPPPPPVAPPPPPVAPPSPLILHVRSQPVCCPSFVCLVISQPLPLQQRADTPIGNRVSLRELHNAKLRKVQPTANMAGVTLADISNVQLRKVVASKKSPQKDAPKTPISYSLKKVEGVKR